MFGFYNSRIIQEISEVQKSGFRLITNVLVLVSLSACGGVLAYKHNDKVFVGPLDDNNLNVMKSSAQLHSLTNDFQQMFYAIDRSGTWIGICRSGVDEGMDFTVYDVLRNKRFAVSEDKLVTEIDRFASTNYGSSLFTQMLCRDVGASLSNSKLVLYVHPQTNVDSQSDVDLVAVEVDVSGTTLKVVDFEKFDLSGSPLRVIARDNPPKGNTVAWADGKIRINGVRVQLNGSAIDADNVKHHFQ